METDEKELAKNAIAQLFKAMGITRVVCVDDVYALSVGYEDAAGLIQEIGAVAAQEVIGNELFPFDADIEVWAEPFRVWWEALPGEKRQYLLVQLLSAKTEPEAGINEKDIKAAGILDELFAEQEFLQVSFTKWKEQRNQLLAESQTNKTLFLFDEDLSNDGGTQHGGRELIRDVLSSEEAGESMCGLLSHSFPPEQEYDIYKAFKSANYGFDSDRVVPVSKGRLYDNPINFAKGIKTTVLNPFCKDLRERSYTIIKKAHKEAQAKIAAIDIYEFEHIVFTASNREGVWEPDTLFRLFGLFQRVEARKKAKRSINLRKLATQIRSVSSVSIGEDKIASTGGSYCSPGQQESNKNTGIVKNSARAAMEIQRLELYEGGDYINYHHIPIELGDIFEKTAGKKAQKGKYILISQPCDLMVRTQWGRRKTYITEGVLARIVTDLSEDKQLKTDMYYELPYFDIENGKKYFVSFLETYMVKLLVLDLCVFNRAGEAKFKNKDVCPKSVIAAWNKYHEKIKKRSNPLCKQLYSGTENEAGV